MKRKMAKRLVGLLVGTCMIFALAGCSGGSDEGGASESGSDGGDKVKIGFSVKTVQEERWQREVDNAEKWAEEMGAELIVQVANNESNTQISQIENMATQGIDVLMVVPVDGSALTNVLSTVHDQGIKILGYDQEVDGWNDAYVGYDSYEIGKQIASYVASLEAPGNYVFLYGDASSGAAVENQKQGFFDAFGDFFEQDGNELVMEQYCKEWAASEGMSYTENALSMTGNDITGVICMNDGIASGAIQALEANGVSAYVTGQDAELTALKRIMDGTQTSTVYKDTAVLSKAAVETAVKLAKNEEIEADQNVTWGENTDAPWIVVDATVVTQENLQEVIIDGGVYTEEEINAAVEE